MQSGGRGESVVGRVERRVRRERSCCSRSVMLIFRVGRGGGAGVTLGSCSVEDSLLVAGGRLEMMSGSSRERNGVKFSDWGTEGNRAVEKTKRSRGWEVDE